MKIDLKFSNFKIGKIRKEIELHAIRMRCKTSTKGRILNFVPRIDRIALPMLLSLRTSLFCSL